MSRQPSPGPAAHGQMYHQPAASLTLKQKPKPYVAGITAGVEDSKYQTKYKELKKRVKEIESDNDRLYLKLLLAKKNIRRMNLERAILYERLAAVPPTPGKHTQELPLEHDPMFAQAQSAPPEHLAVIDPSDHALLEYRRAHPNARFVNGPDGRVIPIDEGGPVGPRGPHEIPGQPHGLLAAQGYRHDSGHDHDLSKQLPLMPAPGQAGRESQEEQPGPNSRYQQHPTSTRHRRTNSGASRHSRSTSRLDQDPALGEPSRVDTLRTEHSRSSSTSNEGPHEGRSRRPDIHDLAGHNHPHAHSHSSVTPTHRSHSHSPSHTRDGSGRIHNHQRMGPGVHLRHQQDIDPEIHRQLLREREIEREREREREIAMHERLAREEEELRESIAWQREDLVPGRSHGPRSDTPASDSAAASPPRPASGQSYEHEQDRSRNAPRVSNLLVQDQDSYRDSRDERFTGGATSGNASAVPENRKWPRYEMEVDDERGGNSRSPRSIVYPDNMSADAVLPLSSEPRGPKGLHDDENPMDEDD